MPQKRLIPVILSLLALNQLAFSQSPANDALVQIRLLARVDSLVSGTGVGPKYQDMVAEVTRGDKKLASGIRLRLLYEYFDPSKQLPLTFFDGSRNYKLRIRRMRSCDDSLSRFGYEVEGQDGGDDRRARIYSLLSTSSVEESPALQCYSFDEDQFSSIGLKSPSPNPQ